MYAIYFYNHLRSMYRQIYVQWNPNPKGLLRISQWEYLRPEVKDESQTSGDDQTERRLGVSIYLGIRGASSLTSVEIISPYRAK